MRIIGGSFGANGKARFAGKYLEVLGEKKADYKGDQVASITVRQEEERQFGVIGAVVGALLLGYLAGTFLGPAGWLAGLVFAIVGSFYRRKRYFAELEFSDGLTLTVETNDYESGKLVKFAEA